MLEFRFLFIRLAATSPFAMIVGAILVISALMIVSSMAASPWDEYSRGNHNVSICGASDAQGFYGRAEF